MHSKCDTLSQSFNIKLRSNSKLSSWLFYGANIPQKSNGITSIFTYNVAILWQTKCFPLVSAKDIITLPKATYKNTSDALKKYLGVFKKSHRKLFFILELLKYNYLQALQEYLMVPPHFPIPLYGIF